MEPCDTVTGMLVKIPAFESLALLCLLTVIKLLHSINTFLIVKKFTLLMLVKVKPVLL